MPTETALATQQTELAPAQSPVAWAIANNVSPEQMLQYYQLDREMKADAARNAYNQAFAAFKSEAVTILKATKVNAGPLVGTMYANLYDVVAAVIPALAKHGLSHSWKITKDDPQWMEVTCFIRHAQGHFESVSMGAAPDAGPGRNAIQARGSAKTYLERYTLLGATGMAAGGTDDDGNGGPKGLDVEAFVDSIRDATTKDELVAAFNTAFNAAQSAKNPEALKTFRAARDKKQAQI